MPFTHGTLLVVGSGPGVGRGVASVFAERGFEKVILMSRNAERLSQDAEVVRSAREGVSVVEIAVDVADTTQLQESLEKVNKDLVDAPLECVLFNAARTAKSGFFDFSAESFENDLKITIIGLYAVAQWATPKLLETAEVEGKTPSFLVTSGMLAKDPYPAMFSLAASKAGQYSLAHSLHKEFEPKGVHFGVIIIAGTVSDDSQMTNARNIAEEAFKVFNQPKGKGTFETVITDPAFAEHVKNRER